MADTKMNDVRSDDLHSVKKKPLSSGKTLIWDKKEETLINKYHKKYKVIIAQDYSSASEAKKYTMLPDTTHLVDFMDTVFYNKKDGRWYYEVIKDVKQSVYLFLDIDREYYEHEQQLDMQEVLSALLLMLKQFLHSFYQVDCNFIEGVNYQVSHTPSKGKSKKFSCHVKFNIVCPSVLFLKNLVKSFVAYIMTSDTISDHNRKLFMYAKQTKKSNDMKCIIDDGIYTNFRAMRMLYCRKSTKKLPMLPYGSSSKRLQDHLVCVYADNPQNTIGILENKHQVHTTDATDITNVSIVSSKQLDKTRATDEQSVLSGLQLVALKQVINTHLQIKPLIGGAGIQKDYAQDRHTHIFQIQKTKCCQCDYAHRIHKKNHNFFEYRVRTGELLYKCYDEECIAKQKQEGTLTFNIKDLIELTVKKMELKKKLLYTIGLTASSGMKSMMQKITKCDLTMMPKKFNSFLEIWGVPRQNAYMR